MSREGANNNDNNNNQIIEKSSWMKPWFKLLQNSDRRSILIDSIDLEMWDHTYKMSLYQGID